jgi:hypothetical protein
MPAATTTPSAAVALTPLATPTANRVVQIEVVGLTFDWVLTVAAIGTNAASNWIPYAGLANVVFESIQSIREMHKDPKPRPRGLMRHCSRLKIGGTPRIKQERKIIRLV